jgi:hypothetical protein
MWELGGDATKLDDVWMIAELPAHANAHNTAQRA